MKRRRKAGVSRHVPEWAEEAEARRKAVAERGAAFREGITLGAGTGTWQDAFLAVLRRDPDWEPGPLAIAGLDGDELFGFLMRARRELPSNWTDSS